MNLSTAHPTHSKLVLAF